MEGSRAGTNCACTLLAHKGDSRVLPKVHHPLVGKGP